jgi:hypothetical protein
MELKESKKVSRIKRYWIIIKNGLFLFGLRNRLAKIGIDIEPYYWVQEEFEPCIEPTVKGGASNYTLRNLSLDELMVVKHLESENEFNDMVKGMERGQLCIGLEHNREIAAYTFVELNDFEVNGRKFKLKPNEAYLLNMWTFHAYRGKNLAPYLRYQTYQLLKEQGRDVKYSITDYFNKSSIKFKKKLNSKNLYLYLSIVLFRKYKWNFTLKKYE